MDNQIYLQRTRRGSPPATVSVELVEHGHNFLIHCQSSDGLNFVLRGSGDSMIAKFGGIADRMKRSKPDKGNGVIRVEVEAEPAPKDQLFTFISLSDIKPNMRAVDKLALLIERFRDSPADIFKELLADYKKLTGEKYGGESVSLDEDQVVQVNSQVEIDAARILPHAGNLFAESGELAYGAQSRIARILKIRNAGETNRQRIFKAARLALEQVQSEARRRAA